MPARRGWRNFRLPAFRTPAQAAVRSTNSVASQRTDRDETTGLTFAGAPEVLDGPTDYPDGSGPEAFTSKVSRMMRSMASDTTRVPGSQPGQPRRRIGGQAVSPSSAVSGYTSPRCTPTQAWTLTPNRRRARSFRVATAWLISRLAHGHRARTSFSWAIDARRPPAGRHPWSRRCGPLNCSTVSCTIWRYRPTSVRYTRVPPTSRARSTGPVGGT